MQSLFVERMELNEELFADYMGKPELQELVSQWLGSQVYQRLLAAGTPSIWSTPVLASMKHQPATEHGRPVGSVRSDVARLRHLPRRARPVLLCHPIGRW